MEKAKWFISVLMFCAFFVLLGQQQANAYFEWQLQTHVDPHYDWTILLSDEINKDTVNMDTVYVTDYQGVKVNVTIKHHEQDQSITIEAPLEGYEIGHTYYIVVEDGLMSSTGARLNPPVKMRFDIHIGDDRIKTKESIIENWQTNKPTFEGNPFIEAPSISYPHTLGRIQTAFLEDGLKMANFIRFLANLPDDLVLDDELNTQAQYGAVVTAANGYLAHKPTKPDTMDDSFFEMGYQATASSNLSQQYQKLDGTPTYTVDQAIQMGTLPGNVFNYMMDEDSSNIPMLGHRRWILNPSLQKIGFGFAKGNHVNKYYEQTFSLMQVFDKSRVETVDYDYIAWPSRGYFPREFFPADTPWSISLNPTKFQKPNLANVEVELVRLKDGVTWTLNEADSELIAEGQTVAGEYFNVNNQGFGISNSIIFKPDTERIGAYFGNYQVTIHGLNDIAGNETTISYMVNFFDGKFGSVE